MVGWVEQPMKVVYAVMTECNSHQSDPWRPNISPCEPNNQATLDPFVHGTVSIFTHMI